MVSKKLFKLHIQTALEFHKDKIERRGGVELEEWNNDSRLPMPYATRLHALAHYT
jgi:hypothetical protein